MQTFHLWRIAAALFLAGFATFSLLYCTQPLLADLAREFHVDAATSAWAVSATTAALALSILLMGAASEGFSRKRLIFVSLCLAALLNLACAAAHRWEIVLAARALEGLALGGAPGTAMAYLADEAPPARLGLAMGLNVSGAAFGGMTGRVAMGVLAQASSWRLALGVLSVTDLVIAVAFVLLLPASRSVRRVQGPGLATHVSAWLGHLRDGPMLSLYLVAFLAMGAFVAVYNYIGFRLAAPPYGLSQAQIGLIFLTYLVGMAASSWAGASADRFGRRPILIAGALVALAGQALTLAAPLWLVVAGVALLTGGFFVVHSVASGWVGRLAAQNRSHAASLYLLAYYGGASLLGAGGGWLWRGGGWAGLIIGCGAAMLAVLALGLRLGRTRAPAAS
jgi:YNFM family putative membrane transporter